MRKGYRNPSNNFQIESDVDQFRFRAEDTYLRVPINWTIKERLAPVERVQIYLNDGRRLENVFIVNNNLAYYYEKSWYYTPDSREEVPKPPENLMDHFNFSVEDIEIVIADNSPIPAKNDIYYLLALFKYDRLDSKKSIENNIFVRLGSWDALPTDEAEVIYDHRKSI